MSTNTGPRRAAGSVSARPQAIGTDEQQAQVKQCLDICGPDQVRRFPQEHKQCRRPDQVQHEHARDPGIGSLVYEQRSQERRFPQTLGPVEPQDQARHCPQAYGINEQQGQVKRYPLVPSTAGSEAKRGAVHKSAAQTSGRVRCGVVHMYKVESSNRVRCSGVDLYSVQTSAPLSMSSRTTASCPFSEARSSGVHPSGLTVQTSAPLSISSRAIPRSPNVDAVASNWSM